MNFCLVFNLGFEKAYLSRSTDYKGNTTFQRAKEYQYGYHEFNDVKGFKDSVKRYIKNYGYPVKVVLNGVDFTDYKLEVITDLLLNEVV